MQLPATDVSQTAPRPSNLTPNPSRRLLVLYGSQTGCAKEVAERIARGAVRRWFQPEVLAMDAYDKVR